MKFFVLFVMCLVNISFCQQWEYLYFERALTFSEGISNKVTLEVGDYIDQAEFKDIDKVLQRYAQRKPVGHNYESKIMNTLGLTGWELTAVTQYQLKHNDLFHKFYFKRPLKKTPETSSTKALPKK